MRMGASGSGVNPLATRSPRRRAAGDAMERRARVLGRSWDAMGQAARCVTPSAAV